MTKVGLAVGVFILACLFIGAFAKSDVPSTPSFNPPAVVSSVTPVFPQNAKGGGTVVVSVSLGAAGEIQNVKIIKGSEGIISSALEAVKQWRFKPATLDGQPIPCEIPVAFSFSWPMACMGGPRTGSFGKSDVPSTPSFNPPAVVSSVTPVFPANALGAGSVVVSVSLDAAGKIQNVKIIKGSEGFNFSALEAIKQWRFKPATLDGQPIPSMIPVAFSFGQPIACMGGPRR